MTSENWLNWVLQIKSHFPRLFYLPLCHSSPNSMYKIIVYQHLMSVVALCSLAQAYQHLIHHPDDGHSNGLWNVGKFLPNYKPVCRQAALWVGHSLCQVKNSMEFISTVKSFLAGPEDIFVSFSFVSLLTVVPIREALRFLSSHFNGSILILFRLVLTSSFFLG